MLSHRKSQFHTKVGRWDTVDDDTVKRKQEGIVRQQKRRVRKRDSWDVELDRGRQKKIRRRKWMNSGANVFQEAENRKQTEAKTDARRSPFSKKRNRKSV
mmetsp:Transcript_22884/g.55536  ORF Transcript_22884/g.55536 Transcript_22884/m.55536 type:complete len:100 (-) Transcript_22884:3173-3472(-)